ncbi:flagellar assembly protein FliH [Variovorax sp. J22P271]|uniref:flagellar assembly protein FliH n=1 Tax=Variovorax davisae TaxID=3053515 RepID=UPI00257578B1|nr:flagellar assembly protein FliH [Variovorax sp. J22P271]MDM0030538.1 flagellar assembly protein FliH [Variovorax sp. J22P271]
MTSSKYPSSAAASPFGTRSRMATAYAPPVRSAASAKPAKPVLSAWQRWEMDTLDEPAPRPAPGPAGRGSVPPAVEAPPSVALLHAAELVSLRREARSAGDAEGRREGHAKGHAEGYAQGRTEGLAAGLAAASVHAEQLRALAASLPAALRRADSELADAVLTLALDVARQVVHRTLRAEPEWVLPMVQDLLHAEPALQGEPRLLLHPDDVALVRNSLGNELQAAGWQVRPDETMTRGGCRVQSATGEMDASLETRWKSVTAALHRDVDAQEV